MDRKQKTRTRGAGILEFALVGVPLIFVITGAVEMARGMWLYQTLVSAVQEGVRYAVVHGQGCAVPPNSCTASISQIAGTVQSAGPGLPPDSLQLTFTAADGIATTCILSDCLANYTTDAWPPSPHNAPGNKITITGVCLFRSGMLIFWPGGGRGSGSGAPAVVHLAASSQEAM